MQKQRGEFHTLGLIVYPLFCTEMHEKRRTYFKDITESSLSFLQFQTGIEANLLCYLITSEVWEELVLGSARAHPAGLNMRGNSTRGLRP